MKTTPLLARPAAPRLKPGAWMGWAGALLLAATGCATCPRDPHTGRRPDPEPAPYMRVACPDAGTVELQIAVRRFGPARGGGPVVWLAGASHIGDPGYYAALQRHLDAQALVLYEGVKELNDTTPSPARPGAKEADGRGGGGGGGSEDDSLQAGLARALGLVFQLDALDYSRPACRNSDLSVTQIQALLTGSRGVGPSPSPSPGTAPGTAAGDGTEPETEFEELVGLLQGTSVLGVVVRGFVEIVGNSPRLQSLTKLAMIELLGHFRGDLSRMEVLPTETRQLMQVLIQERNRAVIDDLKTALKSRPRPASISVVYGAGHLVDMERRLRRELRYCPAEALWLPAFSVNTSGLSTLEIGLVRAFVRAQLALMEPTETR